MSITCFFQFLSLDKLEFPQTVIQKGICLPKEQSADFLKNSEWQFCD